MTRDEMVRFFERRERHLQQRDVAGLMADYADGAVLESPTVGTVTGRPAIEEIYRLWFAAFPDLELRMEDLLVDGGRAAMSFRTVGTHQGEFLGLPPSGKRFELRGVMLYTLAEGQIVRERRVYDFTGLLVQIGVLKAKPG